MSTEPAPVRLARIQDVIRYRVNWQFPLQTRVHPLRSFKRLNTQVFLKREDETGFGIGGSKWRKYASLFPFLLEQHFREVVVIGGAYSNNVLALAQLLNEYGFSATYFLRGTAKETESKGNHLLFRLLTPDERIRWIKRSEWQSVTDQAQDFAEKLREQGLKTYVIGEGAAVIPALAGSMTLALDILRNERLLQRQFDHLITDAGTGMMASALLLTASYLEWDRQFHIVLTAGTEASFQATLAYWHQACRHLLQEEFPLPQNFKLYPSPQAFGRPKKETFALIRDFARTEGVLIDPIYMAPLVQASHSIIDQERLAGQVLLIHSGGGTALTGFGDALK